MPYWNFAKAVRRAISLLPGNNFRNYLNQKSVIEELAPDWCEHKLRQCAWHLEKYAHMSERESMPVSSLGIGTGGHLVYAIGLHLCGVQRIRIVDLQSSTDREMVHRVLRTVVRLAATGSLYTLLPALRVERVLGLVSILRDMDVMPIRNTMRRMNIELIDRTLQSLHLPDGSIDLIITEEAFEQLPADALSKLRRVLASDGFASTMADMPEHRQHCDQSICNDEVLRTASAAGHHHRSSPCSP
jgi:hypothetical protein